MYKLRLYDTNRTWLGDWPHNGSLPSLVIWTPSDPHRYFAPDLPSVYAARSAVEADGYILHDYYEVLIVAEIGRL